MYLKSIKTGLLSGAMVIASLSIAAAENYKIGNLVIENPLPEETSPGAKVAGGYLKIKNIGSIPDRLTGGSAAFAGKVQVHQMSMINEVMKMSSVEGGLEILPGQTVTLKPGGFHIMFMKLNEQLKTGDQRKVQLTFAEAGSLEVTFDVKSIAETMKLQHSH